MTGDAPEPIRIDAGGWGLTWTVDGAGRLRQVGVGARGHTADASLPAQLYPEAYPTLGSGDAYRPAPLAVVHADGTLTTRLAVDRIDRGGADDGEHVVVTCRDELVDFTVEHHVRTHPSSGVVEQWIEIVHAEDGPVRLLAYDSMAPLLLIDPTATLDHFGGGGWADEWRWNRDVLTPGTKDVASLGGVQPHLQTSPCVLLTPDGGATESAGTVIGVSVAWGGNTHIAADVRIRPDLDGGDGPRELRLRAGANPYAAPYVLDPGVRFVTPTVAWTWATAGRDEVTERFHAWTRARVLRHPNRTRGIVVNNWESTFFDFDETRIVDLIDRAADLGADVFLLDDGWFGVEFPRDDDTVGLGDWDADPAKLPGGLAPLADAADRAGIRFGVWVEPEMVNPASSLYEAHPDWVVRDGREPLLHRHQLVLDPLVAEVRDFEIDVVRRTLAAAPGTSYVKWDANRPITDPGSRALGADRQANIWVDGVRATWDVMDAVARDHPDVDLMLCASGGGRTDHGTLHHFHEFWTSDNTDPVTRVRMQWACSHFFPASAMAAHVTRWGERPMAFACAVALSGRFGFDVDLAALSDDELAVCRRAVALARRTQDVVQHGVVRRLVSPIGLGDGDGRDRSRAAWAVVADDVTVAFAYQLAASEVAAPSLALPWLDAGREYEVIANDLDVDAPVTAAIDGSTLVGDGLAWPSLDPLEAVVFEIRPID